FKNLMKQERSSQMLNLFLPPNILEIRTKLQTWLLRLLCQSFHYVSFSLMNYSHMWKRFIRP
ncbi:hypothetical protein S245_029901, partial [Arachis hypogaea]